MINGINEEGIDKLIKDIYNCSEVIHNSIENINVNIDKTKNIFKNDLADTMRFKFDNNKIKFKTGIEKLEKYLDILLKVKMKYQSLNIELTNKLKNDEEEII